MHSHMLDTLAELLGTDPEGAKRAVEQFVSAYRRDLDERGEVDIEGLGRFSKENGVTHFSPDESLSRYLNDSYGHLEPVHIDDPELAADLQPEGHVGKDKNSPAVKESEIEEPETEETASPIEPAVKAEQSPKQKEVPASAEPKEPVDTQDDDVPALTEAGPTPTPPNLPNKDMNKSEKKPKSPDNTEQALQEGDGSPETPTPEDTPKGKEEPATERAASKPQDRPSKQSNQEVPEEPVPRRVVAPRKYTDEPEAQAGPSKVIWIGASVVLIAVLVAVGLFLTSTDTQPTVDAPQITQQVPQADDPAPIPEEQPQTLGEEQEPPQTQPPAQEPVQTGDPLLSADGIDVSRGGYTWIAASAATRTSAEQTAQYFADLGYRAGIVPGESNGRTVYRVGVGQFETYDSAVEAQGELPALPASTPGNFWLLRIR